MFASLQLHSNARQGCTSAVTCSSMHARLLGRCQRCPRPSAARLNQCHANCNGSSAVQEEISSLQNALVKHCVRVRQQRAYREEAGTVVLSGRDLVKEVSETKAAIKVLFVMQGALLPDIEADRVVRVPPPVMQKITGLESVLPSTLAAEVVIPPPANYINGWAPGTLQRLLVLERVQDPGNLGTLLRTALALGWQGALLLEVPEGKNCDPFNDKALRAGRGAAFKLPLASASLAELRRIAQAHGMAFLAAEPHASAAAVTGAGAEAAQQQRSAGGAVAAAPAAGRQRAEGQAEASAQRSSSDDDFERWLWGSAPEGRQAHPMPPHQLGQGEGEPPGVCLILGSEGQGLSDAVLAMSTPLAIPMPGDMESLNVAAAGAILMFALTPGALRLQAALHRLQHEQQHRRRGDPRAQGPQQAKQVQVQPQSAQQRRGKRGGG